MENIMQQAVQRDPDVFRVQRDGSSPSEQAADAVMHELQAEMAAAGHRIRQLVESGAPRTEDGRAELASARAELASTAARIREHAAMQRESAIEEAAQTMAARALAPRAAQATTTSAGAGTPPPLPDVPPGVQNMAIVFLICLAATIILTPLMRAFARRLDHRSAPAPSATPEIQGQLTRMEQAIEAIAVEVERVSEGQRFATRLLAERDKVGGVHT